MYAIRRPYQRSWAYALNYEATLSKLTVTEEATARNLFVPAVLPPTSILLNTMSLTLDSRYAVNDVTCVATAAQGFNPTPTPRLFCTVEVVLPGPVQFNSYVRLYLWDAATGEAVEFEPGVTRVHVLIFIKGVARFYFSGLAPVLIPA